MKRAREFKIYYNGLKFICELHATIKKTKSMKLKIFNYLVLIVLVISSSACTDWLEEANPNQLDKDSFWQTLDETNATLSAAYAALVSDFAINIREEAPRSDLATPGFGRPTFSGDMAIWYNQTYNNSTSGVLKKWDILYMGIFRANQVIEGLANMKEVLNQERWDNQMAQARFLRGLYHYYLHTTYNHGNIIIKDKVPGTFAEMNTPLSTSDEVMEFFRSDLQYAYDHLPIAYESDADLGRATKGAAATILGTSYLYEATLEKGSAVDLTLIDKAKKKFEYVIDSCNYSIVNDMSLLFTTAGEFNAESIFEISFSNIINSEYGTWTEDKPSNHLAFYFDGKGSNANNIFPSLWITYAYLNEKLDMLDPRNKVTNAAGNEIDRPVSLRSSAMIALVQDEYTEYYSGLAHNKIGFPQNDKRTQNGFSRYKHYNNHDIVEDEADLPGGKQHSGKNVTLNRLGDVYLMLAECYIYENQIDKALTAINKIRQRWALELIGPGNGDVAHTYNEVIYDKASLLTRLQDVEKPLETSVEGHCIRWCDLRRWGKLNDGAVFKQHAAEQWWSASFTTTQGDNAGFKNWSTITNVNDGSDATAVKLWDFDQAAINFNYEQHAWYQIPSTEKVTNTGL